MGGKPANLNSVIENQDSDANLQLAFGDVLTREIVRAFKSVDQPNNVHLDACAIKKRS
jgi:hypothetical protein